MTPKVVTFDAANTLVRVRWTPGGFALDCARAAGMCPAESDREVYDRALRSRWDEYREINRTRDESRCDAFWAKLTEDWLAETGQPVGKTSQMLAIAPELLYSEESTMFELFEDVEETLDALVARGIRIGVISNWDYSLHRVLKSRGIHHRFEHVVASLEEGVEKPESRLFHLTLQKFGVTPDDAVHVGDDPVDDFRGAQDAGLRAYLIDRRHAQSSGAILCRLTDLIERIG